MFKYSLIMTHRQACMHRANKIAKLSRTTHTSCLRSLPNKMCREDIIEDREDLGSKLQSVSLKILKSFTKLFPKRV